MTETTDMAETTAAPVALTPIVLDFTHVGTLVKGVNDYLVVRLERSTEEERLFWREDTPEWINGYGGGSLMNCVADQCERGDLETFYTNFKYALGVIADSLSDLSADEVEEIEVSDLYENIESDVYTHDLLKWLAADFRHISLCEMRGKDLGWTLESDMGLVGLMMIGQIAQREDFVNAIFEGLKSKCEELKDEID